MSGPATKIRVLPFVWLTFSGGGVIAAVFLPVLALLFAFAIPLGWIDVPSYAHVDAVLSNPITKLVLIGLFVPMLVHAAHRFRYTLYDGLQVKARGLVAFLCYGGAAVVAVWMLGVVLSA